jgi:anti-sigma factor RsiW
LASGFVDERLEAGELLDFEGHVEGCEACRGFEAGLRRVRQLLRAASAIEPLRRPPPGFAAGVAARLAREVAPVAVPFPAPRTGRRPLRVLAGLAAAAAAVLFFAWSWERLLPRDASYAPVVWNDAAPHQPQSVALEDGSMDSWLREHALLARGGTILGPAEEFEFVSHRTAAGR